MAGLAGVDALALFLGSIQGDATDGRFGLFLDFLLGLGSTVPMSQDEATLLDLLLELVPSIHLERHFLAVTQCLGVDVLLDFLDNLLAKSTMSLLLT